MCHLLATNIRAQGSFRKIWFSELRSLARYFSTHLSRAWMRGCTHFGRGSLHHLHSIRDSPLPSANGLFLVLKKLVLFLLEPLPARPQAVCAGRRAYSAMTAPFRRRSQCKITHRWYFVPWPDHTGCLLPMSQHHSLPALVLFLPFFEGCSY